MTSSNIKRGSAVLSVLEERTLHGHDYHLTAAGRKQLAPLRKEWKELFRALSRLAEAHHA